MYCDIYVLKHVQNVMITLVTFTLRDVYVLYRLRFGTVMLSEATFKDYYVKGAQAWDIQLQGFYTNQTRIGWWLRN
jgi:hypothetical protein